MKWVKRVCCGVLGAMFLTGCQESTTQETLKIQNNVMALSANEMEVESLEKLEISEAESHQLRIDDFYDTKSEEDLWEWYDEVMEKIFYPLTTLEEVEETLLSWILEEKGSLTEEEETYFKEIAKGIHEQNTEKRNEEQTNETIDPFLGKILGKMNIDVSEENSAEIEHNFDEAKLVYGELKEFLFDVAYDMESNLTEQEEHDLQLMAEIFYYEYEWRKRLYQLGVYEDAHLLSIMDLGFEEEFEWFDLNELYGVMMEKERGISEEMISEPTAEPVAEPIPEPVAEPTAEPVAEPTPEPVAEPTAESVAEPTAEPEAEPTAEPEAEPTAEPVAEPTAEPAPTPQPIAESEPTAEPMAEPTAEPEAEPTAEPVAEPTAEPVAEPTPQPIAESKPTPEPVAEPTSEPTPQADVYFASISSNKYHTKEDCRYGKNIIAENLIYFNHLEEVLEAGYTICSGCQ